MISDNRVKYSILIALLFISGYIYFIEISPSYSGYVMHNMMTYAPEAESTITFLKLLNLNILHKSILSNEHPIVELIIEDQKKAYIFLIKNGQFLVIEDSAVPDVIITVKEDVIDQVVNSKEPQEIIANAIANNNLFLRSNKNSVVLALKGYSAVENSIASKLISDYNSNLVELFFGVMFLVFLISVLTLVAET